jgi:hypothetical protein
MIQGNKSPDPYFGRLLFAAVTSLLRGCLFYVHTSFKRPANCRKLRFCFKIAGRVIRDEIPWPALLD